MEEYLEVTGFGSTREEALAYADGLAEQYFGPAVATDREIGRAGVETRDYDGRVATWSVHCEYREAGSKSLLG